MTTSTTVLRPGSAADAIDGVAPRQVAEPQDGPELAALLARASQERWTTVIRGSGTKLDWGRPPGPIDLLLSTARLNALVAHRYGDMTATIQAGARLADVNRALAQHGQWLPLDSAFDDATIGGLVATNDSGPLRHRNGTPRDLVIGMTVAMTDGRLAKSGGTVVKNVAGYDVGKLMSGSFGSLAAIVDVTFKLLPIPATSTTLSVSYDDPRLLGADVAAITASQLEPFALDLRIDVAPGRSNGRLLIRFASSPLATASQVAGVSALVKGQPALIAGDDQAALWHEQVRLPWAPAGPLAPAVVRVSWLPADVTQVLDAIAEAARRIAMPIVFTGRASVGAGLFALGGDVAAQAWVVDRLRGRPELGHVAVLRGSHELKQRVDAWPPPASSAAMARALKQMFDPAGILNAGRGPL